MAKKSKRSNKGVSFTNTEAQNAAKTLLANIRFLSVDDPIRSIVLTSSVPNEGKTTTSIFLAHAAATAGYRVLLVEADMRRRSLARMLGVQSRAGLYSVLSGAIPFRSATIEIDLGNGQTMGFLDVEPGIPNPPDIFASRRFASFLDMALTSYDFLIFDTPPVGTFVDAAVLSSSADATILVVRPNEVKREVLQGSYDQLQKAGGNVIGAVATFVEDKKSEYYYAYYNGEGKRTKSNSSEPMQQVPLPPMQYSSAPRNTPATSGNQPMRSQIVSEKPASDQRQARDDAKATRKHPTEQGQASQHERYASSNRAKSAASATQATQASAHSFSENRSSRKQ